MSKLGIANQPVGQVDHDLRLAQPGEGTLWELSAVMTNEEDDIDDVGFEDEPEEDLPPTTASPGEGLEGRVRVLAEPIAEELGVMLWDLEVLPAARGGKVAVILDRAGASEPGKGISIEEVATFSRQLGYALDAEDLIPFDYRLEVSSPGIERQLRRDEHFAAYVGQPIRVVTSGQVAGRTVHEGLLTGWGPDWITVRPEGGEDVEIPRANLRKARTVFDFSQYDAKPKPGKGGARASKKG